MPLAVASLKYPNLKDKMLDENILTFYVPSRPAISNMTEKEKTALKFVEENAPCSIYEAISKIEGIVFIEDELIKLKKRGFEVIPSVANFLFVRHPSVSGQDFYEKLREAGILVRHFGDEKIRDYNRITIGTDREMDIFLEAADAIIKGGSDEKK